MPDGGESINRLRIIVSLILLLCLLSLHLAAQAVTAGWKPVKDEKGQCQVWFPPEWATKGPNSGAAEAKNPKDGSVVVTSDPSTLKPIPESAQMVKDKRMQGTKSILAYYSAYSGTGRWIRVSVPARSGTCTAVVTYGPKISEETATTIALSVGAAK